jgi:hypothetical protein
MRKENQRIAIAEACGWRPYGNKTTWENGQTYGVPPNGNDEWLQFPNYTEDLNAMHEACLKLNRFQKQTFFRALQGVCSTSQKERAPTYAQEYELIHATAPQRAEAFLRSLNLWKED